MSIRRTTSTGSVAHEQLLGAWRSELAQFGPELPESPLRVSRLFFRFARVYQQLARQPRAVRRALQRRCRQSLSRIALLLALGMGHLLPAAAADIWVTAPAPDIDPGDGACSLIEAIDNANADAALHPDCQSGNGADTIHLQDNSVYTLTKAIYDPVTHGANGLPVIRSPIVIEGHHSVIKRKKTLESDISDSNGHLTMPENAQPLYRLFETAASGDLAIRDATLRSSGPYVDRNHPYPIGYLRQNYYYVGNAIFNAGKVTLQDTTVTGDYPTTSLVNLANADMAITDSTISGYFALHNFGGLAVKNSMVSGGNTGLINEVQDARVVTVSNSTFTIFDSGVPYYGIDNLSGEMALDHCTLSGNLAAIENSGSLTLSNSVISGNSGSYFGPYHVVRNYGTISSNHNLLGDASETFDYSGGRRAFSNNFTPDPTDIVATIDGNRPTPLHEIIQTDSNGFEPVVTDNGGPTHTIALVPGSPAIDAADSANCPPTDQRGVTRPQGAGCDIGAFELEAPAGSGLYLAYHPPVLENVGTVSFVVTLHPASADTVSVRYATKPGTALPGQDYHGTSGILTFHPGETTKTVPVKIIDDQVPESFEFFLFRLSAPVNATLNDNETYVTINDDDPVRLRVRRITVPENVGTANVEVTLDYPNSSDTVSVQYATKPGTALPGQDYHGKSGVLSFSPGETRKVIPVKIINDQVPEPTESFLVRLSAPVNAVIAHRQATVTIRDGD